METIQIQLSPNANKAKLIEAIEMLRGVKSVTVSKTNDSVKTSDNYVKKSIETGLQDAKDIITGKKKGKTLKQLLDED
jgi:ribosomal protein L23